MKIVIIWHNALRSIYRKYIEEIAKQKDVEATLIVPEYWPFEPNNVSWRDYKKENFKKLEFEGEEIPELKVLKLKAKFAGKAIHYYPKLKNVLNKIKPDVVFVYEEPFVFTTIQVITWKSRYSKKTKVVVEDCENLERKFKRFYEPWLYSYTLRNADGMIAMSSDIEKLLRKKGYKGPVQLIGEPADPLSFKRKGGDEIRKKLGINKDEFVICYCGRMHESKGLHIIVEALGKLKKDFKLMVIYYGGEEYRQKVIKRAEELGIIKNILFIGPVKGTELPKYYSACNLGVAASLTMPYWKEQFGRFTAEFILCGVPIIGSSSSTVNEVLGKDAIMYEERNPDELKEKIELIINNPKVGKKMVGVGRKKVLEGFTNQKLAEKFVRFVSKLKIP